MGPLRLKLPQNCRYVTGSEDAQKSTLCLGPIEGLGKSPLARLRVVDSKRRISGYGDTTVGFGIALRQVLQDGINTLKPEDGLPDPLEKKWRPYQILAGSYIQGRSPEYLANEMGIARSTYNHEQAAALDRLLALLGEWEEQSEVPAEFATRPAETPFSVRHGHRMGWLAAANYLPA